VIKRIFKILIVPSILVFGLAGFAAGQAASKGKGKGKAQPHTLARAKADIRGDGITGEATFTELENGTGRKVEITVHLKGDPAKLTPGLHGVHLHAVGKCEPPFTSAGGHFDPGPAGNTDPDANHPFHMGDIPNIQINEKGEGTLRVTTTRVTLSEGPVSLLDEDGSAIIIHKNQDAGITGASKSGVSGGPRIACGVIEKVQ
jgi:Cu-Zn family superoxide dismutase